MEEQLNQTLISQSAMVSDFVEESWPAAKQAAIALFGKGADSVENIILCGCGDSYHAARGLEMAFRVWGRRHAVALTAMDAARYWIPALPESAANTLVIGISASGEVVRTLEALALAKDAGTRTLVFTSSPMSPLGKLSEARLSLPIPAIPAGPGLISFIASLLMGYATVFTLAAEEDQAEIDLGIREIPKLLPDWIKSEQEKAFLFAERAGDNGPFLFIGSGPAYAMALFSAAKVIEASGCAAWAQDVEEWAHVEYFCDPAAMPIWMLSSNGRAKSREREVEQAAKIIGRRLIISRWQGENIGSMPTREALSPLMLWAGPAAFGEQLAILRGEKAFRGFGGGRSIEEGGGASRIRSSQRFRKLSDME
jgi:glucosamine--fructose-6-phosphate aminotransferase (isomerizing)